MTNEDMRTFIRALIADGKTPRQVLAYAEEAACKDGWVVPLEAVRALVRAELSGETTTECDEIWRELLRLDLEAESERRREIGALRREARRLVRDLISRGAEDFAIEGFVAGNFPRLSAEDAAVLMQEERYVAGGGK